MNLFHDTSALCSKTMMRRGIDACVIRAGAWLRSQIIRLRLLASPLAPRIMKMQPLSHLHTENVTTQRLVIVQ